jgi:hypothetical protein
MKCESQQGASRDSEPLMSCVSACLRTRCSDSQSEEVCRVVSCVISPATEPCPKWLMVLQVCDLLVLKMNIKLERAGSQSRVYALASAVHHIRLIVQGVLGS